MADEDEVGTYDDDEGYAEGDPEWTDEQVERAGEIIGAVNDIEDPANRYLTSAGLLTELYGDDLVIPPK